ncbi:hypothetical protein ACFL5V_12595 [Fibrobacterota bacterium]
MNLRKLFAPGAFIKIWGCNSGIEGGGYENDPGVYYWEALNKKNTPKGSIAGSFATFFNVNIYGAKSSAEIQVYYKGSWISSDVFKAEHGSHPPGYLPHKLHPKEGDYEVFFP